MKTDKQVGGMCYSLFNHLQCIADLHIPEIDYETAMQIPENSYQYHTVAFFHNLRLAALENNFANLLTCCSQEQLRASYGKKQRYDIDKNSQESA